MTGAKPRDPVIIAIDGRSGAGKTTLALELAARLREHHSVSLFRLEDIYPGWNGLQRGMVLYRQTLLAPLRRGEEARWTPWDWATGASAPQRTTTPAEIIITEGVGAAHADARDLLDASIWVDASPTERKRRALSRDGDLFAPYWEQWAEQESRWLATDDAEATADLTVNDDGDAAVEQVLQALASLPALQVVLGPERMQRQCRTVIVQRLTEHPDPAALFAQLYGSSPRAVWLDSSNAPPEPPFDRNRFSIMADDGGDYGQWARHRNGLTTVRAGAVTSRIPGPFFRWLDTVWGTDAAAAPADYPADFLLGWLGYLGYELKRETGGRNVNSRADDANLLFAGRAVVYDHAERCVYLLVLTDGLDFADGAPTTQADTWLADTAALIRADRGPELTQIPPPRLASAATVVLRDGEASYRELIHRAHAEISAGNSYEVCLTTALHISTDEQLDPYAVYLRVRNANRAPFASYIRCGGLTVVSTSPERFLRIEPNGAMQAEPIKGTRPRSADPAHDAELRRELAASPKDRAENIMIVDLLRNDLSHFAVAGTVEVTRLCEVESYAAVHQLVSTVTARLRPGADRAAAVAAAFPPGSMTGVPKISTMAILDRLESAPRGVYSGVIGYFSLTGAADMSVTIRTLVMDDSAPQHLSLGVGGAITADSDPAEEWLEVRSKAAGILSSLGAEFPPACAAPSRKLSGPLGEGEATAGPDVEVEGRFR